MNGNKTQGEWSYGEVYNGVVKVYINRDHTITVDVPSQHHYTPPRTHFRS